MNSKLKKLEELEKLLPARPCSHPRSLILDDPARAAEVERICREVESCRRCQRDGGKMFILDISARHRIQDRKETHGMLGAGGLQIILNRATSRPA